MIKEFLAKLYATLMTSLYYILLYLKTQGWLPHPSGTICVFNTTAGKLHFLPTKPIR